jgi:hypothetical protein
MAGFTKALYHVWGALGHATVGFPGSAEGLLLDDKGYLWVAAFRRDRF